jgi:hypothetical protein
MVNKFAHGPIQELKRAAATPDGGGDAGAVITALRRALLDGAGGAESGPGETPPSPPDRE